MLLGERKRRVELFRARAGANGKEGRHTRRASAIEHGVAILVELGKINVRV
jgi:hypothetical protein